MEEELNNVHRLLSKNPGRLPVVCRRSNATLPELIHKNFLVPHDLNMGQMTYVIRKKLDVSPDIGIFINIGGRLIPSAELIQSVYEQYKSSNGILYIEYSTENVFG